jgi:bacterioferritin-associated ferredoxin
VEQATEAVQAFLESRTDLSAHAHAQARCVEAAEQAAAVLGEAIGMEVRN